MCPPTRICSAETTNFTRLPETREKNKAKQAKQNWNNNKKKIYRKIEDWKTNCRADYNIVGLLKSNELVARENTNTNPHGIEQN